MAKTGKPPARKLSEEAPPAIEETTKNLHRKPEADLVTLNLKVPAGFKRSLRHYATDHDTTMTEVLKQAFEAYAQHNV
jgi:hypothetical protein